MKKTKICYCSCLNCRNVNIIRNICIMPNYQSFCFYLNIQMEIQSDENEFLVELEKLMASDVASTLWANNMDLLALTTFDNIVELYRISYKAQRVFQVQQTKLVKSLAFSPDSQLLAYSLCDGSIRLLKTENGEQILSLDGGHLTEIDSQYQSSQKLQQVVVEQRRNAIVKINYFSELKKEFNLLLSSQKSRTLFLLNGFIPIAEINYLNLGFKAPKCLYSHFDGKIRSIVGEQKNTKTDLWLIEAEGKVIQQWSEPLIKTSCLLGYISQVLIFVEAAYDAAQIILREALRQYNLKINLIDDPNVQKLSPCEELFRFLNCGTTSTAVVNFFTKEVYDTKILQKLDETLNAAFAQLHDLLLQSVQNSLERAALLINRLKEISQGLQGHKLGLSQQKIRNAENKLIKLYTMGEVLLVQSTEAKFDIRNLLVWLNKATIKSAGENQTEIQNSKSYLNKYTVDFTRLHGFLSDQNKFKLQNLLLFFSKNKESFRLQFQQPDFNIFRKADSKQPSKQQGQTFHRLACLFQVQEMTTALNQKMQIEQTYKSFKIQAKELQTQWKELARLPVTNVSHQFSSGWKKTLIGSVQQNQLFPLQFKTVIKQGQLFIYFIERQQDKDRLVQYNCHTLTKSSLISTQSHILNIAVAENVLAVLQNKFTGKKIVAQVSNEAFDDSEIQIGKRITRIDGQLDINCSLRGLNSLVIDKNKLIIFD